MNEIYYIDDANFAYHPISDVMDAYLVITFIIKIVSYMKSSKIINKTLKTRKNIYYSGLIALMILGQLVKVIYITNISNYIK